MKQLDDIHGRMRVLLSDLTESLETRSNEAAITSSANASETVRTVILTMLLTGLIGLGLALFLTRRITQARQGAGRRGPESCEGNLEQRV